MFEVKNFQIKLKLIKYIFLILGIFTLAVIIACILLDKTQSTVPLKNQEESKLERNLLDNYSLNIIKPVFEGISSDLLPYKISAQTVSKDNDIYILKNIESKYEISSGYLIMKSTNGRLDESNNHISLTNDISISFNSILVKTDMVHFDLKTKNANINSPVVAYFNNSEINAKEMEIKDSLETIQFKNGVTSHFIIDDFK